MDLIREQYPTLSSYGEGENEPEPTHFCPGENPLTNLGEGEIDFETHERSYAPPPYECEGGGFMACLNNARGIAMQPNRHGVGIEESEENSEENTQFLQICFEENKGGNSTRVQGFQNLSLNPLLSLPNLARRQFSPHKTSHIFGKKHAHPNIKGHGRGLLRSGIEDAQERLNPTGTESANKRFLLAGTESACEGFLLAGTQGASESLFPAGTQGARQIFSPGETQSAVGMSEDEWESASEDEEAANFEPQAITNDPHSPEIGGVPQ